MSSSYWYDAHKVNKVLGEYNLWMNMFPPPPGPPICVFQEGQWLVFQCISEMSCMCLKLWVPFSFPHQDRHQY